MNPFDADPELEAGSSSTLGAELLSDVDALMQARNLDDLLAPADVAVLRELLEAVQQDASLHQRLDAFVNAHCGRFASYQAEAEQDLSWTQLHEEYSVIVSEAVESALSATGRPAWEFFGLLQGALGADSRAQQFVRVMLGWTEYESFCQLMRAARGS